MIELNKYCTNIGQTSEGEVTKTDTEQTDQTLSDDKQPDQSTSGDTDLYIRLP